MATVPAAAHVTHTPGSHGLHPCEDSVRGLITFGEDAHTRDLYGASRQGAPILAAGAVVAQLPPTHVINSWRPLRGLIAWNDHR